MFDANEIVMDAPCCFCGYNGAGYYQAHTHKEDCPFYEIGGGDEREHALVVWAKKGMLSVTGYGSDNERYPISDIYGVIVDGPDDIHGPLDEIEAHRKANELNIIFVKECAKHGKDNTPMHVATVRHWSELTDPDLQ